MIRPVALALTVLLPAAARGDDWPQLLGPHRDGASAEKGLAASWPKAGPPVAWPREVGVVLVNVGAKKAGVVAFALADGKEAWKATDDGPSYSSPVVTSVGSRRMAVFFTRFGADLLDARTGDVLYRQRWRARYDASV